MTYFLHPTPSHAVVAVGGSESAAAVMCLPANGEDIFATAEERSEEADLVGLGDFACRAWACPVGWLGRVAHPSLREQEFQLRILVAKPGQLGHIAFQIGVIGTRLVHWEVRSASAAKPESSPKVEVDPTGKGAVRLDRGPAAPAGSIPSLLPSHENSTSGLPS